MSCLTKIIINFNLNRIENSDILGETISKYLTKSYEMALKGDIKAVEYALDSALSVRLIGPKGYFDREINTAKLIYNLAQKRSH
ncbi:MAG: hypothetical protein WC376_00720 [Candidatus Nanoarchaeia archaeon]|jgi:hypothetical protein